MVTTPINEGIALLCITLLVIGVMAALGIWVATEFIENLQALFHNITNG